MPSGEHDIAAPRKRRSVDPRLIAPIAMLLAAIAIALEIVYAIGHFVGDAFQKIS